MAIKIALAGNPNCGKTTLFNALTGSNQFVGNWPGVTVEKKEGKLKRRDDVVVTDLPGIYSLSPYTLEEVVARKYLLDEAPDVILNLVDGTNIERNLYLTTQLIEIGIPVVVAINMMDIVTKSGDVFDLEHLSRALGCPVVEISALKGTGIQEAAELAISMVGEKYKAKMHSFSGIVEHALAHIEEACVHNLPEEKQRWYSIKIFERDEEVLSELGLTAERRAHIEEDIVKAERELDDDAESIITNERYNYVAEVIKNSYKKKVKKKTTVTEKIDRIVTNKFAALPIFAAIMFLVYFISVSTVGTWATDFMNDGVFGDGWRLFGIGSRRYDAAVEKYALDNGILEKVGGYLDSAEGSEIAGIGEISDALEEKDLDALGEAIASYGVQIKTDHPAMENGEPVLDENGAQVYLTLDAWYEAIFSSDDAPENADYGVWIPGVGVMLDNLLTSINCWQPLQRLVVDGIVGGVGSVLGFVPQIFVLFIILAFLEACGYMSRVAFVMDRIFRKFGLSGKSFIPLIIGTGCSVPGIMASRTIENERDRRMTVITTSFVPCGAKLPVIAMIAGTLFGGAWWLAPVSYFIGIGAVVISGVILKKTKMFRGDVAPFVMELPPYHMPTPINIWRSAWERGWSYIKKAGTVILLSSIGIWLFSHFGFNSEAGAYVFDMNMELADSIIGSLGAAIGWIFAPLGFSGVETAIATIMGLLAKEEIVAVFGVLDFFEMSRLSGFSFLIFNLLCAPCVAAIGAIRREMNSSKWTWFAIGYQCLVAYATSFCIYNIGSFFIGPMEWYEPIAFILSLIIIAAVVYLMVRPAKKSNQAPSSKK